MINIERQILRKTIRYKTNVAYLAFDEVADYLIIEVIYGFPGNTFSDIFFLIR